MTIAIDTTLTYTVNGVTDVLLQIEAASLPEQTILSAHLEMSDTHHCARVAAQDGIGERLWIRADGEFHLSYACTADVRRLVHELASLERLQPHDMPGEAVSYLFDSRYCPADRLQSFVTAEFPGTDGGARVAAIRDWVAANISYRPGTSTSTTTALDTMIERQGVCRDFAHVVVAMARASAIPARYVACYAPGVDPPDFHAVAEVFLTDPTTPEGGIWQIVDATGMADPSQTVKIGVGRDAADVSFLTSFGPSEVTAKTVSVRQHG